MKISHTGTGNNATVNYVINAITYSINKKIPILNFSWGGFSYSGAFEAAINNYKGLFVCSAGNSNLNIDLPNSYKYPAGFQCENMITVGSIDSSGVRSSFSNYGATTVHLFAPGESINSTYLYNTVV